MNKLAFPNTLLARKGLSLKTLLQIQDRGYRDTYYMILKDVKELKTVGGQRAMRFIVVNIDSPRNPKPIPHTVTVIGLDNGTRPPLLHKQERIVVDCDCENHLYMWEYALWKHGAARILRCNGEPPVEKNPFEKPSVCRHTYHCLNYIYERKR